MSSVMDMFSLTGRVVVITGATSGLGQAIAIACAQAGATVAALGRNQSKLDELALDLKPFERPHFFRSFDVTNYDEIPALIGDIVSQCGKIGGFVHSAGIAQNCPLRMMTAELYNHIYAVNVIAGFEFAKAICTKRNLDDMASLLFIASVAGVKGEPGLLAYSSSKGAILSGVRSLAAELSPKKIRVNALTPGHMVDTEMGEAILNELPPDALTRLEARHPLGWGKVSAVTGSAVYFLSPASWWVTGSALNVDGGYCL